MAEIGMTMDESRRRELLKLEKVLGVKFNRLELLNLALTHKSFSNEREDRTNNNERLEFLGDAVLELATSTYLFNKFKKLSEGELTRTRAAIVCQPTLARLANKLGLGDLLLLGHGEEANGGRGRESTLEDALESIIGAIYLDLGWEAARDYVFRQFAEEFENFRAGNSIKDYKTTLQEIIQRDPTKTITYVELNESGPDHMKTFEFAVEIDGEVYGKGIGHTKKFAEQMAAKQALDLVISGKG